MMIFSLQKMNKIIIIYFYFHFLYVEVANYRRKFFFATTFQRPLLRVDMFNDIFVEKMNKIIIKFYFHFLF